MQSLHPTPYTWASSDPRRGIQLTLTPQTSSLPQGHHRVYSAGLDSGPSVLTSQGTNTGMLWIRQVRCHFPLKEGKPQLAYLQGCHVLFKFFFKETGKRSGRNIHLHKVRQPQCQHTRRTTHTHHSRTGYPCTHTHPSRLGYPCRQEGDHTPQGAQPQEGNVDFKC